MDPKSLLKSELLSIKQSLSITPKIKKLIDKSSLPLLISFTISKDSIVDIYDLEIELRVDGFDYIISSIALKNDLPKKLSEAIEKRLMVEYNQSRKSNEWNIKEFIEIIQNKFTSIVSCCPEMLEVYMAEGEDGQSIRRFAIRDDSEINISDGSASNGDGSSEVDSTDSEEERAREYWRLEKLKQEQQLLEQKAKEAEQKRIEYQNDPSLHAKVRDFILTLKVKILSLKEQKEQKEAKNKQGVRMAKTASKKKKFDPNAAAERDKK